jgi:hypothetical protein
MLKHHARRLITLSVLVAALAVLSSSPVERKALATPPNQQVVPSTPTSRGWFCVQTLDPWGNCMMVCCSETACVEFACTV